MSFVTTPAEITVQAPARVNIIGEHTDHNDGFVLPTTTALFTRLSANRRKDRVIEVTSAHFNETRHFDFDDLHPSKEVAWIDYIRGVAAELKADGVELKGLSIAIDTDIPIGGGLSSSASLELSVAMAFLIAAGATRDPRRIAELCQRAERRFAGVQCGIMDQYAVACANKGCAVLLDCRSLDAEQIPIPAEARLILIDSGVRHRLPDGQYNNRTDECAEAVRRLGLQSLRELDAKVLERQREKLGDVLYRRCRHVITENARVLESVEALNSKNLARLGNLLNECHESLRDDFEVSCDEIESLVRIANSCPGVLGSRMVGGGFGGCVLALTTADKIDAIVERLVVDYRAVFGRKPWLHVVDAADPAMEIRCQ